jgi:hypothetical protein
MNWVIPRCLRIFSGSGIAYREYRVFSAGDSRKKDLNISLGDRAGSNLLAYKSVRDDLMHTGVGKQIPRVNKSELYEAYLAVQAYFRQLGALAPKLFGVYTFLTDETTALEKKRIAKGLHKS